MPLKRAPRNRQTHDRRKGYIVTQTDERQAPPKRSAAFTKLADHIKSQETVTDLFKLGNSDDFKVAAHALNPEELTELRQVYKDVNANLDGKVRLDTFDGQVLQVFDITFWHSRQYDNDGVTLAFRPEADPSHKFKAATSSTPIVRFCNNVDEMPTAERPLRVQVKLNPVRDEKRAAQGQRIWSIKRLPMPDQVATGGSPF